MAWYYPPAPPFRPPPRPTRGFWNQVQAPLIPFTPPPLPGFGRGGYQHGGFRPPPFKKHRGGASGGGWNRGWNYHTDRHHWSGQHLQDSPPSWRQRGPPGGDPYYNRAMFEDPWRDLLVKEDAGRQPDSTAGTGGPTTHSDSAGIHDPYYNQAMFEDPWKHLSTSSTQLSGTSAPETCLPDSSSCSSVNTEKSIHQSYAE